MRIPSAAQRFRLSMCEPIRHDGGVGSRRRGHRAVPHTADVIVEAWGPDVPSCCEEAIAALIATYADAGTPPIVGQHHVHIAPASPLAATPAGAGAEAILLDALEEVIFTLDTAAGVPVRARAIPADDGGLDLLLDLADPHDVAGTGAVPKAISRSGLHVAIGPAQVRCQFLVDV